MPLPTMKSGPVERVLLRDVVYDRLYAAILDGTLEPGETLLDETLCAWLGVSRTPIREALMRLSEIGLVEFAPNRYTRVAPIDRRAIVEALYASAVLHEQAARTGLARLGDDARAQLTTARDQIVKLAVTSDTSGLAHALHAFAAVIAAAPADPVLLAAIGGLDPQLVRFIATEGIGADMPIVAAVERITSAAEHGDADAAANVIAELSAAARDHFVAHYRRTDDQIDAAPAA